ncbi:MAG: ATP-dependent Clp protease ATP-binding subunit, partial [Calditrichia bacterium]|nr:ATP-dependent Clp protease ATP-binding subunit [Calditrichia bacterium]
LQILDDGRLTDNKGHVVNFKNTIIIMTSNIGAHFIMEKAQTINDKNSVQIHEEIKTEVWKQLRQNLRPEFLNRVDESIVFYPLTKNDLLSIVDIQFKNIMQQIEEQNIKLKIEKSAKEWLAKKGFDLAFGARPLKRLIQKEVMNKLAVFLLEGEFKEGMEIMISAQNDVLEFNI